MSDDRQRNVDAGIEAIRKVRAVLREHGIEITNVGDLNADLLGGNSVSLWVGLQVPVGGESDSETRPPKS